ncbi:type IV pilus assembly protein PilO [Methylomarinovum caldicuralii]|uniref:Type IV pilus assembly protein PilO n=1 Tax=Methylomarinovum caldicuralii TaxID=438856 RepID=A0AAU9C453_9GAMM|nr:type 4a pilus biogenesis protein PilO [Methylomarinovum caldicuralii]BCX82513.1 type IV pilus assembly protein PilO [Methylomarinovum caldicuralii]
MNLAEINWDLEAAGTWPWPVKLAAILILSLAVAGGWFYYDTQDQLAQLEQSRKQEASLKQTLEIKQKKAANLDAYKAQLAEMEKAFGNMLRQLPNKAEVPALLVDVSQTGLASGLEFELFHPLGEIKKEFYAELPIKVRVIGNYEQLGTFVSGLAGLPRIVTVHNVSIDPLKSGDRLVMNAVIKTYRYLEDEEVTGQKRRKKGRRRGRK